MSCAWNEGRGNGVRKMLHSVVTVDEMQFCFIPERNN